MNKRCIFHVPNYIDPQGKSGSQVRPMKIKKAFENIGFQVDFVMGESKARKAAIKKIKHNINNGVRYDFLYSESSTMPTLLTDKNHLPLHPFLDFDFFKFCKKRGIKIGLFYRDMYWKFGEYKQAVPVHQRTITVPMYKYDLKMYNKLLDILYIPSSGVRSYLPECYTPNVVCLPPGAVLNQHILEKRRTYFETRQKGSIKIFYVGGVNGVYDLSLTLKVLKQKPFVNMTICCREKEWEEYKSYYAPYLTERIQIIHKSGEDLQPYYLQAAICSCFFEATEYRSMAMPIKLFEYVSYTTPIIATKNTEAGRIMEEHQIGWSLKYEENEFSDFLDKLYENQDVLKEKHLKVVSYLYENTWECRAKKVAVELGG